MARPRVDAAAVAEEGRGRIGRCPPGEGLDGADAAAVRELGDDQDVAVSVAAPGPVDVGAAWLRAARGALQEPDADVVGSVVLLLLDPGVEDVVAVTRAPAGPEGRDVGVVDVDLVVDVVGVAALPATVGDAQRVLAARRVGRV